MKNKNKIRAILILALLLLTPVASAQYTTSLFKNGNKIIMVYKIGNEVKWRLVLGGGGCIDDMHGEGQPIMALPISTADGQVGRVVQEVFWNGLLGDRSLGGAAQRYNVNLAGREGGLFTPTIRVQWNRGAKWVRVWSVPQDQWKPSNEAYFDGKQGMMTEYRMKNDGSLKITTHAYFDQWKKNGSIPDTVALNHLQAWTPFSIHDSTFDSVATELNYNGSPKNGKFWNNFNTPFGHGSVTRNTGYATMFKNNNRSRNAISMVYGNKKPDDADTLYILNIASRSGDHPIVGPMIAINPGLYVSHMDPPTYIKRTKYLVYSEKGLTSAHRNKLVSLVNEIEKPIVSRNPGGAWPINVLKGQLNQNGSRTSNLGELIK